MNTIAIDLKNFGRPWALYTPFATHTPTDADEADMRYIGALGAEFVLDTDSYTIDQYNRDYNQTYAYYWLEYGSVSEDGDTEGYPVAVWGSYSVKTDRQAYFVATL